MSGLVALNFDERLFKEIFNKVKPIIEKMNIPYKGIEIPHISVGYSNGNFSNHDISNIKKMTDGLVKPKLKLANIAVFDGKIEPSSFLVVLFDASDDMKLVQDVLSDELDLVVSRTPHSSILKVPIDYSDALKSAIPEIKDEIKRLMRSFRPTHFIISNDFVYEYFFEMNNYMKWF